MSHKPYILLDDQLAGKARYYEDPIKVITAYTATQLEMAFTDIQSELDQGHYIAGFVSYEAGYALEPKLTPLLVEPTETPLLQMGVFKTWSDQYPEAPCEAAPQLNLKPGWQEKEYLSRFEKVIDYIKAGDVYQINLTFPLLSRYEGSALCFYDTLRARQPVHYGGVISIDDREIVSFSPELFFNKECQDIDMRPMKGTVKRLPNREADLALRESMRYDIKSQAENLMIVDLLRNDLSKIAKVGSVKVPHLFALETYPTLHQMTSTVTAKLDNHIKVRELFTGLFPCGSVTGAPKIRAMEIIHELEAGPRGPYCGAIGFMDPDGNACFNVAIRTAIIKDKNLRYHVGSGVVLDSHGKSEYEECLLKAKLLAHNPDLIETFRWTPSEGIIRRDKHMARLTASADALGYALDQSELINSINAITSIVDQRVRLSLSIDGNIQIQAQDYKEINEPVSLSLSRHALSQSVQETRHKLSARDFYDGERNRLKALSGCGEVIFANESGEICEGSFTNIFIKKDRVLLTPPLSSGLLPGVLRAELIETGKAIEEVLYLADLALADEVFVGNSLRGLIHAKFISFQPL